MLIEMKPFSNEAYYVFFSALANRTRLAIIDVLKDYPKTILEISEILDLKEKTVTDTLKPLVDCMIVDSKKTGKENRYFLNKEIIEPLSEMLDFHVNKYCPGLEKCIPPSKLREYMKHEAAKTTYIEHE